MVRISGRDEIGNLAGEFSQMAVKIDELINEVYKEKLIKMDMIVKQREAELNALQSQINPHFLFNTLDSIRMHSMVDEKEKVSTMLTSLSKLFRYSINRGDEIVTIASELANVRDYIEIHKIRYGDLIAYRVDMPEPLLNCRVPKLILQPVIENAFIHGLKNKRGALSLEVKGEADENGNVSIIVCDDGCGIDEAKLEEINNSFLSAVGGQTKSVGIRNVNERVKLYFGKQFGLFIESKKDAGTKVYIKIHNRADQGVENC